MAKRHGEVYRWHGRDSMSLALREVQIKTIMRHQYIPISISKIKKYYHKQMQVRIGKLDPYAVELLRIYLREMKTYVQTKTYT